MENLTDQIQVSEVSVGALQFLNASGLESFRASWNHTTDLMLSDRRVGQAMAHGFLSLRMAFRIVTSFRMQATMATFAGFPAARSR